MTIQDLSAQLYDILKEAAEASVPSVRVGYSGNIAETAIGNAARAAENVGRFLLDPVGTMHNAQGGHGYLAWHSLQSYYPDEQRALFRRPQPQLGVLVVPVGAIADGLGVNEIAHTAPCLVYPDGSVVRVDAGPVTLNDWSKLQVTYETGQIPGNGLFVPLLEGPEAELAKHVNRLLIIAQHVNNRDDTVYDLLAGGDNSEKANMNCNKFTATAFEVLAMLALYEGQTETASALANLNERLKLVDRTIHGVHTEQNMVNALTVHVLQQESSSSAVPQTQGQLLVQARGLDLPNGLPPGSEGNRKQTPPPSQTAFMGVETAIDKMLGTPGLSREEQDFLGAVKQQSSQNRGLAPAYDLQQSAQKAASTVEELFKQFFR